MFIQFLKRGTRNDHTAIKGSVYNYYELSVMYSIKVN